MTRPPISGVNCIGFDADDTLWHNETFFRLTQDRFTALLADHADADQLGSHLLQVERRNLGRYGFGIKAFTLSMIETALEVTEDRVPASVIRQIVAAGQDMLNHSIELLPGARETVESLGRDYRLILVTKGDLLDQERKLAQSGLGEMFDAVEIVSDKSRATYDTVFARHGGGPQSGLMVGNSLKSDILPALAAGAWGVHVPSDLTWALEWAEAPTDHPRFRRIVTLADLPPLLENGLSETA